ncbi:hypothetical protein EVC14_005 [Rhizobium phage RHph_I3_18]|nr:hypothetical protein EVC14_005 [Rhizobium phage RHph_I3_18]
MIANWGACRGQYRGQRYVVIEATPEEWAITEKICDARDIWKQNQVQAVFKEVRKLISFIDENEHVTTLNWIKGEVLETKDGHKYQLNRDIGGYDYLSQDDFTPIDGAPDFSLSMYDHNDVISPQTRVDRFKARGVMLRGRAE